MFENLDLVIERLAQPRQQIGGLDILFDAVGAAVEPALAPARQVEHGLAQGLRRDRAGMNRHAADAAALFDHKHRLADFRGLDGGAAAGRTAADDDHVIVVHAPGSSPSPKSRRPPP
jgi:hypothetical protein